MEKKLSNIANQTVPVQKHRQERFIQRWVDALTDVRVTHEIQGIWVSYWSQVHTFFLPLFEHETLLRCQRETTHCCTDICISTRAETRAVIYVVVAV
jgi:hypothetical protein